MRFTLIWIGAAGEQYVSESCALFLKKLAPLAQVSVEEVVVPKSIRSLSPTVKPQREFELWRGKVPSGSALWLLDERGKQLNSLAFAKEIEGAFVRGRSSITMVIGGAFGHCQEAKSKADAMISMSVMTMNHDLIRVVMLEQLYRGLSIIKGLPYHNE